jgi:hypothetical protein
MTSRPEASMKPARSSMAMTRETLFELPI